MSNKIYLYRGQGTIEYLVIMAVVVVIGLLVVGMMSNFFDSSVGVSSSLNKLNIKSGVISISNLVVDSDGGAAIGINNVGPDRLTITNISVNGKDSGYDEFGLAGFSESYFNLNNLVDYCDCDYPGQKKICEVVLTGYTTNEILVTKRINVEVSCVGEVTLDPRINPVDPVCDNSGTGTEVDPINICNCVQLQAMQDSLSSYYLLGDDIDCSATTTWNSNKGFIPVGHSSPYFSGSLNGNGYTISNLFMDSNKPYAGLFGKLTSNANLYDVALTDVNVISFVQSVGALAGRNEGIITKASSSGNVYGQIDVGGLVGNSTGTIQKSYSAVVVDANGHDSGLSPFNYGAGGLVGVCVACKISDSYASGDVNTKIAYYSAGGLVGKLQGIQNNEAYVTRSYATGNINYLGINAYAGGLVGSVPGDYTNIDDSFAVGIPGVYEGSYFGGIIGHNNQSFSLMTNTHYLDASWGCIGGGDSSGCFDQTPASYFYSQSNAPLDSWDWDVNWLEGSSYPTLR